MDILRRRKKIGRLDKMTVAEIEEMQRKLVHYGFPILITGVLDNRTITIISNMALIHKKPKSVKIYELPTDGTYPSQRKQLIKAYDNFYHHSNFIRTLIIYDIFREYRHIFKR